MPLVEALDTRAAARALPDFALLECWRPRFVLGWAWLRALKLLLSWPVVGELGGLLLPRTAHALGWVPSLSAVNHYEL